MSAIRRAYEEGRAAFYKGVPATSPYLRHLPEDEAWLAGWEDACGIEPGTTSPNETLLEGQHSLWESPLEGAKHV